MVLIMKEFEAEIRSLETQMAIKEIGRMKEAFFRAMLEESGAQQRQRHQVTGH